MRFISLSRTLRTFTSDNMAWVAGLGCTVHAAAHGDGRFVLYGLSGLLALLLVLAS